MAGDSHRVSANTSCMTCECHTKGQQSCRAIAESDARVLHCDHISEGLIQRGPLLKRKTTEPTHEQAMKAPFYYCQRGWCLILCIIE